MTVGARIQVRRDTATNWTTANSVLAAGEAGLESDTGKIKYGDGTTAWTSLAYFAGAGAGSGNYLSVAGAPTGVASTDTAAIQAAIDAASAAGGGKVTLANGTYVVSMVANSPSASLSTAIVLRSNVTVEIPRGTTVKLADNQASVASANNGTIFRNANPFLGAVYPMPSPDHDMGIVGEGVIDGNCANQSTVPTYGGTHPVAGTATNVYFGVRFDSAKRCRVEGVTIKNCRGLGGGGTITSSNPSALQETFHLAFYRCGDFYAKSVRVFTDDGGLSASGIGASFSTVGRFENCTAHHMTYGVGMSYYDSAAITVKNCHSFLNGGHGFLTEYSHDILFEDCLAGGAASNDDRSSNKIAVYSSDAGVAISVGPATGGTFTLTIGGQTTSALAYNATAATVQAAVAALTSVGAGNATVTAGTPTGPFATYSNWDITLTGAAAGQAITGTSSLTAGIFRLIPHVILGNSQDALGGGHGFQIDTGNRITIRGGHSAYNGNLVSTNYGGGLKVIGTPLSTTVHNIDGLRIFGNRFGVDFTNGDGAAACNARARVTRISPNTIIGVNKGQTDALAQQELGFSSGMATVSRGKINTFLQPAVGATTVAVSNPFPFDMDVQLIGGTYTAVTITPGGPAPGAATSVGTPSIVRVPHGGSIAITYSVAPTWAWFIP